MFERKGLQTAAILTDTFRRPGDAMGRVQGFSGYRYAVVTHPISSLDPEQIRARARLQDESWQAKASLFKRLALALPSTSTTDGSPVSRCRLNSSSDLWKPSGNL